MTNQTSINEDIKNLVLARLQTLNPDSKILLMGEKETFTVRDMMNEVKKDSELGRRIVEVQMSYIKMLASGEIDS